METRVKGCVRARATKLTQVQDFRIFLLFFSICCTVLGKPVDFLCHITVRDPALLLGIRTHPLQGRPTEDNTENGICVAYISSVSGIRIRCGPTSSFFSGHPVFSDETARPPAIDSCRIGVQ
jgi:hypothetical protein